MKNKAHSLLKGLKVETVKDAIVPIQKIQAAFVAISQSGGDNALILKQEEIINAHAKEVIEKLPEVLPVLQAHTIVSGSLEVAQLLGKLLDVLQSQVPAEPVPAEDTRTDEEKEASNPKPAKKKHPKKA